MDNLILNENRLLTEEGIRHFTILASRAAFHKAGTDPRGQGRQSPDLQPGLSGPYDTSKI